MITRAEFTALVDRKIESNQDSAINRPSDFTDIKFWRTDAMRKSRNNKCFIALWVIVPMVTALAFMPKVIKDCIMRKYTSSF
ncbi:hypothetical protein SDC9_170533 [bioreactor metagenome]|uniref:Uncharacterized protein n=1 Tax=bioreactor metagenome TaxID=1076179 RepID=A0A645GAJ1_9ZZZZ|nr:hypothetical protein [Anaerotignum propionicum]